MSVDLYDVSEPGSFLRSNILTPSTSSFLGANIALQKSQSRSEIFESKSGKTFLIRSSILWTPCPHGSVCRWVDASRTNSPFPICKSCSANCAALSSPKMTDLIFFVNFKGTTYFHTLDFCKEAFSSSALVPLGTTGSVCLKSPARTKVIPPIS